MPGIDDVIAKMEAQNTKLVQAARARFERFQRIAANSKTPARKRAAERNMQIVIATLSASQREMKATVTKLRSIEKKAATRKK